MAKDYFDKETAVSDFTGIADKGIRELQELYNYAVEQYFFYAAAEAGSGQYNAEGERFYNDMQFAIKQQCDRKGFKIIT